MEWMRTLSLGVLLISAVMPMTSRVGEGGLGKRRRRAGERRAEELAPFFDRMGDRLGRDETGKTRTAAALVRRPAPTRRLADQYGLFGVADRAQAVQDLARHYREAARRVEELAERAMRESSARPGQAYDFSGANASLVVGDTAAGIAQGEAIVLSEGAVPLSAVVNFQNVCGQ